MTKPCCCDACCCGLKGCCITIGIITIVVGCCGALHGAFCIKVVDDGKTGPGMSKEALMAVVAFYIVVNALYLGPGICLIIGATNKNSICCWIWIGGASGLLILDIILSSIIAAHYSPQSEKEMSRADYVGWFIFCLVIWLVLHAYFIWVVISYIKEIKK